MLIVFFIFTTTSCKVRWEPLADDVAGRCCENVAKEPESGGLKLLSLGVNEFVVASKKEKN